MTSTISKNLFAIILEIEIAINLAASGVFHREGAAGHPAGGLHHQLAGEVVAGTSGMGGAGEAETTRA